MVWRRTLSRVQVWADSSKSVSEVLPLQPCPRPFPSSPLSSRYHGILCCLRPADCCACRRAGEAQHCARLWCGCHGSGCCTRGQHRQRFLCPISGASGHNCSVFMPNGRGSKVLSSRCHTIAGGTQAEQPEQGQQWQVPRGLCCRQGRCRQVLKGAGKLLTSVCCWWQGCVPLLLLP